jgi:hypothetical protein
MCACVYNMMGPKIKDMPSLFIPSLISYASCFYWNKVGYLETMIHWLMFHVLEILLLNKII